MQQGGGGGGHQSQYGEMGGSGGGPTTDATSSSNMVSEPSEQLEEASPISYRPPAIGNSDKLTKFASGGGDDEDGGGGGGVRSGGNRWPRQETLALLKIRSDMDTVFRDASIKGPLWEDVSRKLAQLGYRRSSKKCKEKFENVQKYYKRTKDGRAGRQDGKSYKFFTELEALHHTTSATMSQPATTAAATSLDVAPISVGIPMPISSVRITPTTTTAATLPMPGSAPPPVSEPAPPITNTSTATPFGISFSSNSSSSSQGYDDEDEPSNMAGTSRKRKRQSSSSSKRMMEFFEGLMKQVMQKQEALQQIILEAIEKSEQDRMIREEAWKRREVARLASEHELIAQERALASSRDAAIVSCLQKITGQTIQLPTKVTISTLPNPPTEPTATIVPPPTPIPVAAPPLHQPPSIPQQQQQQNPKESHSQHQQQTLPPKPQNTEVVKYNQQPIVASEVIMAIPEQKVAPQAQEIGGSESNEPASFRWPKAEVLALINVRSGLETRYQEAGPKGPLWEEISAAMNKMGYKRNPKRCKEKWENINKYYKKVKESNKKRPEDAKTCPYFHQLDALYRRKIVGGGSSSFSDQNRFEGETLQGQQHQDPPSDAPPITDQSENKTGDSVDVFGKGNGKAVKKSENIVRDSNNS